MRHVVPSALFVAALSFALQVSAHAQAPESLPECVNNGPYVQECDGQYTYIPVTSAGSFDPDGTPVTVWWFETCTSGYFDDPTSPDANFVIDMDYLCTRTCAFQLRVISGGQTKSCNSTVTSQDTSAPVISGPVDVTAIWGDPTDVASTGVPSVFDACDPTPEIEMIGESLGPSLGPGHEGSIVRTWEAEDSCEHTSQVQQTITVLSPLYNSSNLEVDLNQCDDVFDLGDGSAYFEVVLLGKPGTLVTGIQPGSLRLSKLGDQVNSLAPMLVQAPLDVAVRAAARVGECNPAGTDGLKDRRLRFDRNQARALLGLDALPAGTAVYIAIRGKRNNNTSFIAGAKMIVQ